jgi:hypothetical protein
MSAPLFRDPVYDGAADPVIVRNYHEQSWWLLYTARRANAPSADVSWVHGSDIGVASSVDAGATWTYRGTLQGLNHEFGHNTFWAPEFVWHDGVCHMYVSYIRGVPERWAGHERHIHHYTSDDMVTWTHHGALDLESDFVIDACVFALPGGGFRMWYKNEAFFDTTWACDSNDLYTWHSPRRVLTTPGGHEGPNVFAFRDRYWLIVDSWDGQRAFVSTALAEWQPAGRILEATGPTAGARTDDVGPGFHADVIVDAKRAFIVYFTHPDRDPSAPLATTGRRSSIQVAELHVVESTLFCDRNWDLDLHLSDGAI